MERRKQKSVEAKSPAGIKQILNVVEQDFLREHVIAIGISTGGPPALACMLEQFKPPLPPILIVQHMPAMFTQAFAKRLDHVSELRVKEAETCDALLPNHVYVAPGGKHMELQQSGREIKIGIREGEAVAGHRPSVDVLFESASRLYGERMLGVIMTGMGRDGVQGCAAVRKAGGYVLGQDETTSDVYGMNKIAFQLGYVDRQFSLQHAAEEIMQYVKLHWSRSRVSAR
jgi:two-component system chemotaxis response regulator CheB